jgi:hypothetical protein
MYRNEKYALELPLHNECKIKLERSCYAMWQLREMAKNEKQRKEMR